MTELKKPNLNDWATRLEWQIREGTLPYGAIERHFEACWEQGRLYGVNQYQCSKMKKDIIQVFNSESNKYVKYNRTLGTIISCKKTPYKNVPLIKTKNPDDPSPITGKLGPPIKTSDIDTVSSPLILEK